MSTITIRIALLLCFFSATSVGAQVKDDPLKIGVAAILSGDFASLGRSSSKVLETYRKHYLRHPVVFKFEDAKVSGIDGLNAFQKLLVDGVKLILSETTSNGLMASSTIINDRAVPVISLSTGGYGTDKAGLYIFRFGHSDVLNGVQEAEQMLDGKLNRVALLAEETEYTQDISRAFIDRLQQDSFDLIYRDYFIPGTTDFRSFITVIRKKNPDAIFIPTQTGTALALFLVQWNAQAPSSNTKIHTSFVAASNEDARKIAGKLLNGVYYMAPAYNPEHPKWKEFVSFYSEEHGGRPAIPFRAAGIIDALDILQEFLDHHAPSELGSKFGDYIINEVRDYQGLLGTYNFNQDGNAELGFHMQQIRDIPR